MLKDLKICGENINYLICYLENIKLYYFLSIYSKINYRWNKNVNVKKKHESIRGKHDCILKNVKDKETRLRKTSTNSLMDKYKYESCLEEIALLEDGNIMTWINQYFLSWLRYANVQVLEEHVVGFCYVYYGYDNYYNYKNSTYCTSESIKRRLK